MPIFRAPVAIFRGLLMLLALGSILLLSACGGGSGAPNNLFETPPTAPPALAITPSSLTLNNGAAGSFLVSGGTAPYTAFSSDPAVVAIREVSGGVVTVVAGTVGDSTTATITVRDAAGSTRTATVTVRPPVAVQIQPTTATVYAGTPAVFTITGGAPPYSVFSTNASVLPAPATVTGNTLVVVPANIAADTEVQIRVQDSIGGTSTAAILVRPAPLINGLTIAADRSPTTCGGGGTPSAGGTVVCSGDTGTASVQLRGPGGTSLSGRQVRFEVVQGDLLFFTGNPAQPQASSVTIATDANGSAIARFQTSVTAPSAFALVRATDLTTGNQVTGSFTIAQITAGDLTLRVVPSTARITGAFTGLCSSGFVIDYYVFGGTPPYRVVPTFPNAVTLLNAPVLVNGGAFRAITNGTCVNPLQFAITDATGRTTTAELVNEPGTTDLPTAPPPSALIVEPTTISLACPAVGTASRSITIAGGTPPYNVRSSNPTQVTLSTQLVGTSPGNVTVNIGGNTGRTTITVIDSGAGQNQQTQNVIIDCTGDINAPTLAVTPGDLAGTCPLIPGTGQISPMLFTITGGVQPYRVVPVTPTPGSLLLSQNAQGVWTVQLQPIVGSNIFNVLDSANPPTVVTRSVTCAP